MSDLADKLSSLQAPAETVRRGPQNTCFPLYGPGDIGAWEQVERLRAAGVTWAHVQVQIDDILEVDRPIPISKFIYHWRRRCFCWAEADRR